MPKSKPQLSDLIQVVTIVGETHVTCDVAISLTTAVLDEIERRTRHETTRLLGRRLNHVELTDTLGRMAGVATKSGDDGAVVAMAVWLAIRGSHSNISLGDLVAGGTLVVSTDDPAGAGTSWRYRLSGAKLDMLSPTMDEMTVH